MAMIEAVELGEVNPRHAGKHRIRHLAWMPAGMPDDQ